MKNKTRPNQFRQKKHQTMKKTKLRIVTALVGGSLLFSSCIGSFGLWSNLKDWNQGIGNKFVNEVVFLAFHIVPVYEVAYLADILVLNSIEFWSGSNPVAELGSIRTVQGENGNYAIRTNKDGYTITKEGEEGKELNLVYNAEKRTWNAEAEGQSFELIRMNEDGTISYQQQDGSMKTIVPNAQEVAAAWTQNGESPFFHQ